MLDDVLESIDVSNPLLKDYDKENEKYNSIYDTSIYSSEKTLLSLEVSNSNIFPEKYDPNNLIYCSLFDENISGNQPTDEELQQLKFSVPELPLYNPLNQYYNPEFDKTNPNFNPSKLYSFGYVKDLIPCVFPLIPYIKKYNPTYEINEKHYSLYNDRFIIMQRRGDCRGAGNHGGRGQRIHEKRRTSHLDGRPADPGRGQHHVRRLEKRRGAHPGDGASVRVVTQRN